MHSDEQRQSAEHTLERYRKVLSEKGLPPISTEIIDAPPFYYAETYLQQYLPKNPGGYCGLGGTGVCLPKA